MYSDKANLSILTSLLREHDVRQVVVCPGSRNAAIVHNLTACPEIICHPATDERSAAFEAMGISLATNLPAAVCVTSGTALLNTLPAVAEAWYQHIPLVVISADRPAAWIEQLDGQTLNQPNALSRWCALSVNLPEVNNETDHWHCNWLVNKALLTATHLSRPVHINIPLSEPLYNFTETNLPTERVIRQRTTDDLISAITLYNKVMLVTGQNRHLPDLSNFNLSITVINEPLAWCNTYSDADSIINQMDEPEMIIYLGGTIVSKNIKEFLRCSRNAEQWFISTDGDFSDTFMNLTNVLFTDNLPNIISLIAATAKPTDYATRWHSLQRQTRNHQSLITNHSSTPNHQESGIGNQESDLIRQFETAITNIDCNVCYANSMSVRYACRHARHPIFCNRGVNGIEGTLSTALGIARASSKLCFCILGDLSFFYDSNALWRTDLPQNLRILVLNNGGGKIFSRFTALNDNPAKPYVTGLHHTSCRDLCNTHNIPHRLLTSLNDSSDALSWLISGNTPKLLEFSIH